MPDTACLHIRTRESDPIQVVELPGSPVRIGRAPYCEVRLSEPDLADEECRLKRRGGAWQLVPSRTDGFVWIDGHSLNTTCDLPFDVPFRVGDSWLTLRPTSHSAPEWYDYRSPEFKNSLPPREEVRTSAPASLSREESSELFTFVRPAAPAPPSSPTPALAAPARPFSNHGSSPSTSPSSAPDYKAPHRYQERVAKPRPKPTLSSEEQLWENRWRAAGERIRARPKATTPPPVAQPFAGSPTTPTPSIKKSTGSASASELRRGTSAGYKPVEPKLRARSTPDPLVDRRPTAAEFPANEPLLHPVVPPSVSTPARPVTNTPYRRISEVPHAEPSNTSRPIEPVSLPRIPFEPIASTSLTPGNPPSTETSTQDLSAFAGLVEIQTLPQVEPAWDTETGTSELIEAAPFTDLIGAPEAPRQEPETAELDTTEAASLQASAQETVSPDITPLPPRIEEQEVPLAAESPKAESLDVASSPDAFLDQVDFLEQTDILIGDDPIVSDDPIAPVHVQIPAPSNQPSRVAPDSRPPVDLGDTKWQTPPAPTSQAPQPLEAIDTTAANPNLRDERPELDARIDVKTESVSESSSTEFAKTPRAATEPFTRSAPLETPRGREESRAASPMPPMPVARGPFNTAPLVGPPSDGLGFGPRLEPGGRPTNPEARVDLTSSVHDACGRSRIQATPYIQSPSRLESDPRLLNRQRPAPLAPTALPTTEWAAPSDVPPGSANATELRGQPVPLLPRDWPAARDILASHQASVRRASASSPAPKLARVEPSLTESREPSHWSIPLWLGWPLLLVGTLLGGTACLALAFIWSSDSRWTGMVSNALAQGGRAIKPLPSTVPLPDGAWWKSSSPNLMQWALYFDQLSNTDPSYAQQADFFLNGAAQASPVQSQVRLAQARIPSPHDPAMELLAGLRVSQDIEGYAELGHTLFKAGHKEAALKAYRRALEMASLADPVRARPPEFDDNSEVMRYYLPNEDLIRRVIRDMADQSGWSFSEWSQALPSFALVPLTTIRVLQEKGSLDTESAFELILSRLDEPAPEGTSNAVHLAAQAEALALKSRWTDAVPLYREAIEETSVSSIKRAWWMNLAEISRRLNDDQGRLVALGHARGEHANDEIAQRAGDLLKYSGSRSELNR